MHDIIIVVVVVVVFVVVVVVPITHLPNSAPRKTRPGRPVCDARARPTLGDITLTRGAQSTRAGHKRINPK